MCFSFGAVQTTKSLKESKVNFFFWSLGFLAFEYGRLHFSRNIRCTNPRLYTSVLFFRILRMEVSGDLGVEGYRKI